MIGKFKNQGTEDVFEGVDSKEARKVCPINILTIARRKLDRIEDAKTLDDLKVPPSNRLEKLKGDRAGQYAIRINDQYRVCFLWEDGKAEQVEIVDYH